MGVVRTLASGDITLTHTRERDDFGFLRDYFRLTRNFPSGYRVNLPLFPPIKVRLFTRDTDITDDTSDFTDAEYLQVIEANKHHLADAPDNDPVQA